MGNLHQLDILPEQSTINLIASYSAEFDSDSFNYHQLIEKVNSTILGNDFMTQEDNADWMNHEGYDYIRNPKLFSNAPLTYLCAFLSESFKHSDIQDIERKISPTTLQAILKRLNDFK